MLASFKELIRGPQYECAPVEEKHLTNRQHISMVSTVIENIIELTSKMLSAQKET